MKRVENVRNMQDNLLEKPEEKLRGRRSCI